MKVENVCIIDDDEIYQFITTKYLKDLNLAAHIMTFSDGEQAIEYLSNNHSNVKALPDLIFLDINMPYMDGWSFLNAFTKIKPTLPRDTTIYMVSSSNDDKDREKALSYGIVADYFVKPLSADTLASILRSTN